jgi:hypothetical protein
MGYRACWSVCYHDLNASAGGIDRPAYDSKIGTRDVWRRRRKVLDVFEPEIKQSRNMDPNCLMARLYPAGNEKGELSEFRKMRYDLDLCSIIV